MSLFAKPKPTPPPPTAIIEVWNGAKFESLQDWTGAQLPNKGEEIFIADSEKTVRVLVDKVRHTIVIVRGEINTSTVIETQLRS
jgi:hypothetical protein